MKSKNINKLKTEKIMIDEGFVPVDSANVTPRIKNDGSIIVSGFKDMFSSLKDLVVVGGDFV